MLVDDGLATGATMRAAVAAVRAQRPKLVVVAVPTAPLHSLAELRREADEVVAVVTPEPFHAVGLWYEDFRELSDDDVRRLLPLPAEVQVDAGEAAAGLDASRRRARTRAVRARLGLEPLQSAQPVRRRRARGRRLRHAARRPAHAGRGADRPAHARAAVRRRAARGSCPRCGALGGRGRAPRRSSRSGCSVRARAPRRRLSPRRASRSSCAPSSRAAAGPTWPGRRWRRCARRRCSSSATATSRCSVSTARPRRR